LETGSLAVELTPLFFLGLNNGYASLRLLRPRALLALFGARSALTRFALSIQQLACLSLSQHAGQLPIHLWLIANCRLPIAVLLNLFMRRMLPATLAELLELQTARGRLFVLRRRVVPLFAVAAL
jgi:hypothetical protein